MHMGNIEPNEFFSSQTAQGLRVTLHSTIELSMYLLEKCNFDYVLTAKICQFKNTCSVHIVDVSTEITVY